MVKRSDRLPGEAGLGRRSFLGAATIGAGAAIAGVGAPARALSDGSDAPQVDFPSVRAGGFRVVNANFHGE